MTTQLAPLTPQVRRVRRLSMIALPFVAALALGAHGWDTALEWWRASDLTERRVAARTPADYAGATWQLTALTKVGDRPDGTAVVLAEFEAQVHDTAAFSQLPCTAVLSDAAGRRWAPTFLPPSEMRKIKAAEKPTCGSAMLKQPEAGSRVTMAESYEVPAAILSEIGLVLSLPAGRPEYLRFE